MNHTPAQNSLIELCVSRAKHTYIIPDKKEKSGKELKVKRCKNQIETPAPRLAIN
jgi:hypothetical protein